MPKHLTALAGFILLLSLVGCQAFLEDYSYAPLGTSQGSST